MEGEQVPVGSAGRRSTTRRRGKTIAGYLIAAAVLVGLAGYLGYGAWHVGGFWRWVGAAACGFVALILVLATGFREGPCPACGQENTELKDGEFRPCVNRKCQRYLAGNGSQLWLVADDVVMNAPTFGAVLKEQFGWPAGCCVCGQPATRVVPVTLHVKDTAKNLAHSAAGLALGRLAVRTAGGTLVTVNAPHCAEHMDGVALESPTVGPLRILFRSHRVQQQFRKHNNVPVD
jgi:hypothetical protein